MLTIKVDESKCTGCGTCAAVCSLSHGMKNGKRSIDLLPKALVFLEGRDQNIGISICRHCESPVCVSACVANALYIDDNTGVVGINTEKCVGCWSCVMECPFNALRISTFAAKCDGCIDWDKPLCASFCPKGAITAERNPERMSAVKRRKRAVLSNFGGTR